MPLGGFFGGGSSSKPQPLSGNEDGSKEKKDKKDSSDKEGRGTVLKLQKTTITIEKKLAEGGFAIVYLVSDKQNRQYALKRQFINDDPKQVEACKREYQIISSLRGHKNIVCYADHLLYQNKSGVYDYMLLTAYYKTSVLQCMNERLASGRGFSCAEVLRIFCDICEAVARLHHSQTPVIHRDLKVENILVDERNRAAPPTYVLCDFGSATTKVLSSNTHPIAYIQEEVEKYTTLSYRSPEMIDVYGGRPIGTKSDTWAMGVMLFKLCYFTLPFGESAMAIQNGAFSFPAQPAYPDSIKAIIKCLLDAEIDRRPSVFECASLAFEASGAKECPVKNVFGVSRPPLSSAVDALRSGQPMPFARKQSDSTERQHALKNTAKACSSEAPVDNSLVTPLQPSLLCSTSPIRPDQATTTSVAPRLRPKPISSVSAVPSIPPSPQLSTSRPHPTLSHHCNSESDMLRNGRSEGVSSSANTLDASPDDSKGPLSCPLAKPPHELGFTDLEEALPRIRAQTDVAGLKTTKPAGMPVPESTGPPAPSTVSLPGAVVAQSHRRNVSDTSHIIKSAFKPYSQTIPHGVSTSSTNVNETKPSAPPQPSLEDSCEGGGSSSWNPFLSAPYGGSSGRIDDVIDGDGLRKSRRNHAETSKGRLSCSSGASIDSLDPFGAAPFEPPRVLAAEESNDFEPSEDRAEPVGVDSIAIGLNDGQEEAMQMEEDSEVDEQRMSARRRYSYEHIDGVGEEGSSDSRGRTEGESTDDLSRNEESSHDEDNDSSQQTDVASDDGGGRPLLEDDGLEDDMEEDLLHHPLPPPSSHDFPSELARFAQPLSVDARRSTNPFVNVHSDLTPKISPAAVGNAIYEQDPIAWPSTELDFSKAAAIFTDQQRQKPVLESKPSLPSVPPLDSSFAPATLPRQSTPLSAAPRPPVRPNTFVPLPTLPSPHPAPPPHHTAPALGALIPVVPIPPSKPPAATQMNNSASQIKPGAPAHQPPPPSTGMFFSVSAVPPLRLDMNELPPAASKMVPPREACSPPQQAPPISKSTKITSFVEGPKTPRPKKSKEKERKKAGGGFRSSGSEFETDGSEAEMCSSISSEKTSKKKKSSGFLRTSNPSVAPLDTVTGKKSAKEEKEKRKMGGLKKGGGAPDASFVNSSFQAEDMDSPPIVRSSR